jgi:quercetin dioxygenase-like cupin family protein
MQSWNLDTLAVEPHTPTIVSSTDDARAILLYLPAGERLQDHEVHERARVVVVAGELEITTPDGESVHGGLGLMAEFDPGERHEVHALTDARFLLLLSPWPGDGHPGAMTLEEKATARERARLR